VLVSPLSKLITSLSLSIARAARTCMLLVCYVQQRSFSFRSLARCEQIDHQNGRIKNNEKYMMMKRLAGVWDGVGWLCPHIRNCQSNSKTLLEPLSNEININITLYVIGNRFIHSFSLSRCRCSATRCPCVCVCISTS
jgi:hypothetical protein